MHLKCDKNSKLVKYLTEKKPVQTKTIKLTKLNFGELKKNRRLLISVDSENMLIDLKCVNSSQKDSNKSFFKVSSISNGISSVKGFVDQHKIPLILLILLIISIIITLFVLRFFLKKYFICTYQPLLLDFDFKFFD